MNYDDDDSVWNFSAWDIFVLSIYLWIQLLIYMTVDI